MTTLLRPVAGPVRGRTVSPVVSRGPWLLAALTAAVYSGIAIVRYRRFEFSSYDLGIFTQSVDAWAHGHLPTSTIRGGPGFALLGDHFSPAVVVLAPAYLLAPSPVTLLVAQGVLFGMSVVPLAGLAERRLGRPSAVALAVAYVLSWGLQYAVVVDFHEVALAVPLLAAGLCAVVDRRWRAAVCWLVPLLLVKEDLGLTVAVAGLVMYRRGGVRPGLWLAAVGTAAAALTILVLVPWAAGGHQYAYADSLAGGLSWHRLLGAILPGERLQTLMLLLGVTVFAALRSPLVLLALPTLGWRFLSDNATYWGHEWHYSAVLMPIVFVALVDGLVAARRRPGSLSARASAHVPAVVATIAVLAVHVTPLGRYLHADAYRGDARTAAARQAIALVPPGAVVETDIGLMSHLTAGRHTYFAGNNTGSIAPQWFVTDQAAWGGTMVGTQTVEYAERLHPHQRFVIVFERAGITVLRAVGPA